MATEEVTPGTWVDCAECGKRACLWCSVPMHTGKSCAEAKVRDSAQESASRLEACCTLQAERQDEPLMALAQALKWQQCPKCRCVDCVHGACRCFAQPIAAVQAHGGAHRRVQQDALCMWWACLALLEPALRL